MHINLIIERRLPQNVTIDLVVAGQIRHEVNHDVAVLLAFDHLQRLGAVPLNVARGEQPSRRTFESGA